jgi:hypothetical protein
MGLLTYRARGLAVHALIATVLAICAPSAGARTDVNDSSWCAPPRRLQQVDGDDFRQGLARWRLEAQDARTEVRTSTEGSTGVLDIQTPAGLSLWWRDELQGDYAVRFTATALPAPASAGPLAGRISDLNMFWNATEAAAMPQPRSGAFADYDPLRLYYVGFGANGNTTTRLRYYDGQGQRHLLDGFADAALAEPGDRQGPMRADTRLLPGQAMAVQIISRQASDGNPLHLIWSINGRVLFTQAGPAPLLRGWFALRTTASHLQLRAFQVLACRHPN